MTRLDQMPEHAGEVVREQARRRASGAPAIAEVKRRHDRRAAWLLGTAAAVVGIIAAVAISLPDSPSINIDDSVGEGHGPTSPPSPTSADALPGDGAPRGASALMLPAGWTSAPNVLDALEGKVVAPTPGSPPIFAVGTDLVVVNRLGEWEVERDVLSSTPEMLTAAQGDGYHWVLALNGSSATLLGPGLEDHPVDQVPQALAGEILGVAWHGDAFVVVGSAAAADQGTPTYELDPASGAWSPMTDVPLAVNRPWNTSVVSADGAVVVTGAWLNPNNNAPARPTLGAAVLARDTDTWQLVDGGVLSPQAADAVAVGDRVLAADYEGQSSWVTATGWTAPLDTGADAGECPPQLAARGDTALSIACFLAATYSETADAWRRIAVPMSPNLIDLGTPIAGPAGFLVPRSRLTVSEPVPLDLLALDVETVWPLAVGHDGLLATPDGWTVSPENLTPNLAGPVERVTASTAPMPVGGDRCAQVPEAAMEALGPDDALVSIQYRSGRASPGVLALGGIAALKEEWTNTSFLDCASNASDLIAYWIEAQWAGEFYYLLIVHHREGPEAVINEALAVANSFVPI